MIREKRTQSGGLLEIDFYPVFDNGKRMATRKKKEKPSTAQQEQYNQNKTAKKMVRLTNLNFDNLDYYFHPTYSEEYAPQDIEKAKRDIFNYLRKVKKRRVKKLSIVESEIKQIKSELANFNSKFLQIKLDELKEQRKILKRDFKYIYVIEKKRMWHFHLFITGGLSKNEMESLWNFGVRVNTCNYNPKMFGYERAAAYMSKSPKGGKAYVCSRNLEKPEPKTKDGTITRYGVAKMAQVHADDAQYWERKYKGYRFVRAYPRYNNYNNHWYMSVVMYKKTDNPPPKWKLQADEWLVEDFGGDFSKAPKNITKIKNRR